MSVTIYHNPRCSKSRQTLELLREHGVEPEVIEYLQTPPTREQLLDLLSMLGLEPLGLMRHKEEPFKRLALDGQDVQRDALIDAMLKNPILIERPIVVSGGRAAIGRPPENVLDIL